MMDAYGQMTLNSNEGMERGFYGAASGLAWIQRAKTYFGGSDSGESPEAEEGQEGSSAAVQLFDAPLPSRSAVHVKDAIPQLLPPRETAEKLLRIVSTQVYPMLHFLDERDFHDSADRLYEVDPSHYQERDQAFVPLFHLVTGVGYLFSKEEHDKQGCRSSIYQG